MINPLAPCWSIQHASPDSKYTKTTIVVLDISEILANEWHVQWRNIHEVVVPYLIKMHVAPVIVDATCFVKVKVKN